MCIRDRRGSVQEFMAFVSKTIVERTQTAARQSVKEGGNVYLFELIYYLFLYNSLFLG